jgi:DNA-binding protein
MRTTDVIENRAAQPQAPVKDIIVGNNASPAENFALAVAYDVAEGHERIRLLAQGNNTGKAVKAANLAAARKIVPVRPKFALVTQKDHPNGGKTTHVEIPLYNLDQPPLLSKPDVEPTIVGKRETMAYAMAVRAQLLKGKPVVLRGRFEAGICKALNAACLAANLKFCQWPGVVFIGEEQARGASWVPFVEIVLHTAA